MFLFLSIRYVPTNIFRDRFWVTPAAAARSRRKKDHESSKISGVSIRSIMVDVTARLRSAIQHVTARQWARRISIL
jgi:hypothetical protein